MCVWLLASCVAGEFLFGCPNIQPTEPQFRWASTSLLSALMVYLWIAFFWTHTSLICLVASVGRVICGGLLLKRRIEMTLLCGDFGTNILHIWSTYIRELKLANAYLNSLERTTLRDYYVRCSSHGEALIENRLDGWFISSYSSSYVITTQTIFFDVANAFAWYIGLQFQLKPQRFLNMCECSRVCLRLRVTARSEWEHGSL